MVPSFNREAVHNQKVTKLWTFSVRGWGGWAQPHFIAFVGVFSLLLLGVIQIRLN